MAYYAYIVKVENLRPHSNADRLQIATFFGNDTCVGLDVQLGDIGIYFPVDGQVSQEFAEKNNLLRKKDDAGNNIGGYMDERRAVKAIKLRGEKSDGLYMPITALEEFGDYSTLNPGDRIDVFNGHEICCKYIPRRNNPSGGRQGNRTRKTKVPIAPLFKEHVDTEQLQYNLGDFRPGDTFEITLKLHGTSQRTGHLPVFKGYDDSWACRVGNAFRHMANKIAGRPEDYGYKHDGKSIYDWGYVSGTRRTVLENYEGGYYGDNEFREAHSKVFEGKLWRGETAYYEVVGFTSTGQSIMSPADNTKLQDKEFVKQYGKTTVFSYGCELEGLVDDELIKFATNKAGDKLISFTFAPQSDLYVYRMTMTTEEGDVIEYTPEFMRYRCEQMGVKSVPVFGKGIINLDGTVTWQDFIEEKTYIFYDSKENEDIPGESIRKIAEKYFDGPDPIGKTHVREGVVVRITNRNKFCAYKHKNFSFKVLENIIKLSAESPDMEEAQEVKDE